MQQVGGSPAIDLNTNYVVKRCKHLTKLGSNIFPSVVPGTAASSPPTPVQTHLQGSHLKPGLEPGISMAPVHDLPTRQAPALRAPPIPSLSEITFWTQDTSQWHCPERQSPVEPLGFGKSAFSNGKLFCQKNNNNAGRLNL